MGSSVPTPTALVPVVVRPVTDVLHGWRWTPEFVDMVDLGAITNRRKIAHYAFVRSSSTSLRKLLSLSFAVILLNPIRAQLAVANAAKPPLLDLALSSIPRLRIFAMQLRVVADALYAIRISQAAASSRCSSFMSPSFLHRGAANPGIRRHAADGLRAAWLPQKGGGCRRPSDREAPYRNRGAEVDGNGKARLPRCSRSITSSNLRRRGAGSKRLCASPSAAPRTSVKPCSQAAPGSRSRRIVPCGR